MITEAVQGHLEDLGLRDVPEVGRVVVRGKIVKATLQHADYKQAIYF